MKKIAKVTVSVVLLMAVLLFASECAYIFVYPKEVEMNGVSYVFHREEKLRGFAIKHIDDNSNPEEMRTIIIPDSINGTQVKFVGKQPIFLGMAELGIGYTHTERIYFPWTIRYIHKINFGLIDSYSDILEYMIFATNVSRNVFSVAKDFSDREIKCVITNWLYEEEKGQGTVYYKSYFERYYIPANISYMFNYDDSPNEGYFFIDLLEETGTLLEPPYPPQRTLYKFVGWYKDEACTAKWDFENDEVKIHFDEEGNCIYEEIKLYAGWEKENWWDWFRK